MHFQITRDLTLTDEHQPPGAPPNRYVLLLSGAENRFYQPYDRVAGYGVRASRLVGAWALGARGARTEEERMAALRYLCGLPAGTAKPQWSYKKQAPATKPPAKKKIDRPKKEGLA
jgi:hypothetical protein